MDESRLPRVIEPAELARHRDDARLRVVFVGDAESHARAHIPGSGCIDYADLNRQRPPAGGLLPEPGHLAQVLGRAGITPETHVVACDASGNGRASRLLWTLDCLGHDNWSLLNGGLVAWHADGLPLQTGPMPAADTPPYPVSEGITRARADRDEVLASLDDPNTLIVDARSPGEYRGDDRRAVRGGHIPGAVNVEWTRNVDADNAARLHAPDALRQMYADAGVTPEHTVIAHCQTHHRSALTYVVLRYLGFTQVRGYDGSWSDWGNDPETPIVTGPAPGGAD